MEGVITLQRANLGTHTLTYIVTVLSGPRGWGAQMGPMFLFGIVQGAKRGVGGAQK
jgi:hypothetical protein